VFSQAVRVIDQQRLQVSRAITSSGLLNNVLHLFLWQTAFSC